MSDINTNTDTAVDDINDNQQQRNKAMCVLCHVPLNKGKEDYQFICSKDKSHKYQIYAEIISYDNQFSTIYEPEEESQIELAGLGGVGEPVLLSANNDNEFKKEDPKKSDIKIPKYMQDNENTTVTYFRED